MVGPARREGQVRDPTHELPIVSALIRSDGQKTSTWICERFLLVMAVLPAPVISCCSAQVVTAPSIASPAEGTILVVEDDAMIRDLIGRTLERKGYRAVTAECAEDARVIWEQRKSEIALLITDIVMPGENGLELAASLQGAAPELPVLVITGYAPAELIGRGRQIHHPLLTKPFTAAQLLSRVQGLLGLG